MASHNFFGYSSSALISNCMIDSGSRPLMERAAKISFIFILAALITILSFTRDGYAGRPLTVDDAAALGKGENELELGAEAFNASGAQTDAAMVGTYSRGLTKRGLQFTFGLPFSSVHPRDGATARDIGDFVFELKAALWGEGKTYPAFTLKPLISFPTGDVDAGTGSGEVEYVLAAILSKGFGPFAAHFNLAISHAVESEEETIFYGLALEVPATPKLSFVSEITLSDKLDLDSRDRPIETLLGLTYKLKEGIVLDLGLKLGLNDVSTDFGALIGATISF